MLALNKDTLVPLIKKLVVRLIALVDRYPFAVALFGFISGVLSFLLVERKQEFAQFIAAIMLVSWIWLILENLLQRGVAQWFGFKLPPPVLSFVTQMVHQESLFFVVPFFFVTTVWNSGQVVFTSFLMLAAFVSIVDPIYYRFLAARRWLYFLFHGMTLFAVLLTSLPIIFHLPTAKSYQWALIIAVLLTFPSAAKELPLSWWKRGAAVATLILISCAIGLWARPWIPPAGLWLTNVAVADRIDDENREPENVLKVISEDRLRNGLYAYTAIHAPRGLNERIYHVWRLNGMVVDKIALDIKGGREAGYRAWTHKMNFPPYPQGNWQIQVMTDAHQVIGVLRFKVVKSMTGNQVDESAMQTGVVDSEVNIPTTDPRSESPPQDSMPTNNPAEIDETVIDPNATSGEPVSASVGGHDDIKIDNESTYQQEKQSERKESAPSDEFAKPVQSSDDKPASEVSDSKSSQTSEESSSNSDAHNLDADAVSP